MSESRLAYLFRAYFNKTATAEERDELMVLLEQADNDTEIKDLLATGWEQQDSSISKVFSERTTAAMLSEILAKAKIVQPSPVIKLQKKPVHRWHVAAAAVLFCAMAGAGFLWIARKPIGTTIAKTKSNIGPAAIVPGSNKAILTLSDGSAIALDSTRLGALASQGNAQVVNANGTILSYHAGSKNDLQMVYNTLSTPGGGQYQLVLADGTKVWLNASSSIHFPSTFKGKERNVAITGEAYFEVAKNASMPFTVTVKDVTVQVLGTHFDVMAYNDENSINTTLLEGSVRITKGSIHKMLVPGQQSRVDETGQIEIAAADVEEVTAWKNGLFQFNGYSIETIMRQISRWYDVEVVYEGEIPKGHFSGIVNRSNNISQVLKIMEAGGVGFRIGARKITVFTNGH
jgi:ferric-dicitrate binding protein FerR (iron transport regulator)